MFLDLETICSDEQELGANVVATYVSDRSVDLWNGQATAPADVLGNTVGSDPGKSGVEVLCQAVEDFDSAGGAATVQAQLVSATNAALTSGVVVHRESAAVPELTAKAGYHFGIEGTLPPGITQRFAGFRFLIAGETTTAGKVTAAIGIGVRQLGDHAV